MDQFYNYGPVAFPVFIQTQSVGENCNMNCSYCTRTSQKPNLGSQHMEIAVLEEFTKQYIDAQIHADVRFYWRGGEPLLRGLQFFEKAVYFQKLYREGKKTGNVIRTNGLLLDHEWCEFFKRNDFQVEIVIDGSRHCHDRYRRKKDGTGTYDEVMLAVSFLQKYKIRFTVIAYINDYNVHFPLEIYHFFKTQGFRNIHFEPLTGFQKGAYAEWSVSSASYGEFLCKIFDEWIRHDVGKVSVSIFEDTLRTFCKKEPANCMFAQTCGHFALTQFNGEVYACSHFNKMDYLLGNLQDQTITGMLYGRKQLRFGQSKRSALTVQCKKCEYLRLCNGGCPKDRIGNSNRGEKGHNILCLAYLRFFKHATPAMTFMAEEIAEGGSPARIMSFFEV